MIRLTRQTDYGVLLLTVIASHPGRGHTARELAESTRISQAMVSKVLKLLAQAGLLQSQLGVKGGYSLARPAEDVTVREIVDVLEGPIAITVCSDGNGSCEQEGRCPVEANWRTINQAIHGALEAITLADMAAPCPVTLSGSVAKLGALQGSRTGATEPSA
ncbi:MAG: SUF system Fe-S cluster assembly regulator [Planctomycetota bacterium]